MYPPPDTGLKKYVTLSGRFKNPERYLETIQDYLELQNPGYVLRN